MTATVKLNNDLNIVEIVYFGRVTANDIRATTTNAITLVKNHDIFSALIDAEKIELVASLFDILDLPNRQYNKEGLDHSFSIALVEPKLPQGKEAAKFYENACVNRGWLVKTFQSRLSAINWLISQNSLNQV